MAKPSVICIFSNKGGTGKTTVAVHLAVTRALELARAESIENVILDLPPHSSAQVAWLLGEADLILVPTRATATDLVTLKQTIDLVHAAKRPAGFVLNAFRPHL